MKKILFVTALSIFMFFVNGCFADTKDTNLEKMPAELETRFALSALPAALREYASVYLLDPQKGYTLSRTGKGKLECLVERTVWEWVDYRNDIYIPLCYDANGVDHHLKVIKDAAQLRASGLDAVTLKTEIEKRYANKTYTAPSKAGLSYMVGPVMRAKGPPDMDVHTMAMPHLMFYSPYITNEDIGAKPDLHIPESLRMPFVDKQGNAEQSYLIQLIGDAEKANILSNEKELIAALCAYRAQLCLDHMNH